MKIIKQETKVQLKANEDCLIQTIAQSLFWRKYSFL